jgi:acyl dehydratase
VAERSRGRPTRPGDALRVNREIVESTPSQSNPEHGIVTMRSTLINQNGDAVHVLKAKLSVPKRPS